MRIAAIGLGFRGPGDATDADAFYHMIKERREAWSPIPATRWSHDAVYHPDAGRTGTVCNQPSPSALWDHVQGGHWLAEDLARFDAPFFNLTKSEADAMDPQQRLLLECCSSGLENAGIPLEKAIGSNTVVFSSCFGRDYTEMLLQDPIKLLMYYVSTSDHSTAMTANCLSYFFDFRGPSVSIDTACSGGLVALHLACQSLRTGEADQALVAGQTLLSPDGRCYAFDERANGYARGEGAACIVLKPLDRALQDGDPIRAVIRASGINQDGRTPGITMPSQEAYASLIRSIYKGAGLNPLDITY